MNKAFTLIELLVVVLIIGILSAIALPQYEKAVEKSRATEGVMLTRAILDAQQRYYMANGTYTKDLEDLDIEIPGSEGSISGNALSAQSTKYFDCAAASLGTDTSIIAFCLRKESKGYYIVAHQGQSAKVHCGWWSGNTSGEKWCKILTGKTGEGEIAF